MTVEFHDHALLCPAAVSTHQTQWTLVCQSFVEKFQTPQIILIALEAVITAWQDSNPVTWSLPLPLATERLTTVSVHTAFLQQSALGWNSVFHRHLSTPWGLSM